VDAHAAEVASEARLEVGATGRVEWLARTQAIGERRSNDAGRVICEALYWRLLDFLRAEIGSIYRIVNLSWQRRIGHAHDLIRDLVGFLLERIRGAANPQLCLHVFTQHIFGASGTTAAARASGLSLEQSWSPGRHPVHTTIRTGIAHRDVTIPRRERGGISLRRNLFHAVSLNTKVEVESFPKTLSWFATQFFTVELRHQVRAGSATADKQLWSLPPLLLPGLA
jgi:hypothetical protein